MFLTYEKDKVVIVKDNEVWEAIGMSWTSRDWERALLGTFRRGPPDHRDAGRRPEKKIMVVKEDVLHRRGKSGGIGRIDIRTLVPERIIGASGISGRSDIEGSISRN